MKLVSLAKLLYLLVFILVLVSCSKSLNKGSILPKFNSHLRNIDPSIRSESINTKGIGKKVYTGGGVSGMISNDKNKNSDTDNKHKIIIKENKSPQNIKYNTTIEYRITYIYENNNFYRYMMILLLIFLGVIIAIAVLVKPKWKECIECNQPFVPHHAAVQSQVLCGAINCAIKHTHKIQTRREKSLSKEDKTTKTFKARLRKRQERYRKSVDFYAKKLCDTLNNNHPEIKITNQESIYIMETELNKVGLDLSALSYCNDKAKKIKYLKVKYFLDEFVKYYEPKNTVISSNPAPLPLPSKHVTL